MSGAAAERDGDFAGSAMSRYRAPAKRDWPHFTPVDGWSLEARPSPRPQPIRTKPHFLLKAIVLGAAVLAFGGGAVAALVLRALGAIGP